MIRPVRRNVRAGSALFTSVWAVCSSCGLPAGDAEPVANDEPPGEEQGSNAAALVRAASCEDVLARIQTDTIARLIERAEELRQPPDVYTGDPVVVVGGDEVLPPPPSGPLSPAPEAPADSPPFSGGAPSADAASGVSGPGFSGTTAQVREVDEADVIKAEGDDLYVLQGSSLVKVRAWPPEQAQTLAAVAIEGSPYDMFVSDGRAVVFSSVSRDLLAEASDRIPGYYGYYPYRGYTKVTVLDIDTPSATDTPSVVRESYLEGYYVASRRHDDVVRAVIQDNYKVPPLDGLYIEYFTPFGEPYRQQDIDAQVDAWLERTTWAVT